MAADGDYKTLANKWPLDQNQRGSPLLDALIAIREAFSREELAIARGAYFAYSQVLTGVAAGTTNSYVIHTNDQFLVLEDLSLNIDYSAMGSGSVTTQIQLYVMGSNRNSWAYVQNTPQKIGTALHAGYINADPDADVYFSPSLTGPTGVSDYRLYYEQAFIDTQANRLAITRGSADLFEKSRKIILPSNSEALLQTTVVGNAPGTMVLISNTAWTQGTVDEVE